VTLIVVSGAPGTGKSTIARELGADLRLCVLSLDPIKEGLADILGLGDEDWSARPGRAAGRCGHRYARRAGAGRGRRPGRHRLTAVSRLPGARRRWQADGVPTRRIAERR
jgi:hypothetical protein